MAAKEGLSVTIPFPEFSAVIQAHFPTCHIQEVMACADVHVFDPKVLQEEVWPVWCQIVKAINDQVPNAPLRNNSVRGICDEIVSRFVAELSLSTRQRYGDEDVGPGVRAVTVLIPAGYSLNMVPGYGAHRTTIMALKTDDTAGWQPYFVEPQLTYAQYQITPLADAVLAGVDARESWI